MADTGLFYPDLGQQARPAKAWCAVCPVRQACLEYALASCERWGVWGGLTEHERRAVLRSQRRAVAS